MSDDNPEYIVSNDLDEGDYEVEFIGIVDNRNTGCVGDTVINALDKKNELWWYTMVYFPYL